MSLVGLLSSLDQPVAQSANDLAAWGASIGGGVSVFIALMSLGYGLRSGRRASEQDVQPPTLDQKLNELSKLSTRLSDLSREVRDEADAQREVAERAAVDAKRNQQLASLSASQADAVSELLQKHSDASTRSGRRTTIIWTIVSVVLSNVASIVLTLVLSPG
jgi:hypothetical protein